MSNPVECPSRGSIPSELTGDSSAEELLLLCKPGKKLSKR